MSMDHKDWLKEQIERSTEMNWEREDIMALRLKVQFLTLENEKQRERILILEEQIRSMKEKSDSVSQLHKDWELGHGWGKGKDE